VKKLSFGWSVPLTLVLAGFLLSNAWWRIQSIRLGYKIENLNDRVREKKEELSDLDKKISVHRSISHLDHLARHKFRLTTPDIHQIIYLNSESDAS